MYVLHGCGGITTVQARLAEHGLCNFVLWNPSPPDWRFRYLTYLKLEELKRLLADVTAHYGIRLYQDTAVCQHGFAGD